MKLVLFIAQGASTGLLEYNWLNYGELEKKSSVVLFLGFPERGLCFLGVVAPTDFRYRPSELERILVF